MTEFPLVGKPGVEIARRSRLKIHQQLGEVNLWVNRVAAAGGSQAGQDGRRAPATRIADEQGILATTEIFP